SSAGPLGRNLRSARRHRPLTGMLRPNQKKEASPAARQPGSKGAAAAGQVARQAAALVATAAPQAKPAMEKGAVRPYDAVAGSSALCRPALRNLQPAIWR